MDNITRNDELRELALFAGAGGGILGGLLCGFRTVCAVEIDAYCRAVLCARQNEGILAPFPIWDDVRTFDGREWRGHVDIVSGGFPCTDISTANPKGKGLEGKNSGLWSEMRRIVGEVRPALVLVENSANIANKGGARVVGDLAALGYDCKWGIVSAADAGAPHLRKRWWCLAYANGMRQQQPQGGERNVGGWISDGDEDMANAGRARLRESGTITSACQSGGQQRGIYGDGIPSLERKERTVVAYPDVTGRGETGIIGGRQRQPETIGTSADVADANLQRCQEQRRPRADEESMVYAVKCCGGATTDTDSKPGRPRRPESKGQIGASGVTNGSGGDWWETEPAVGRVAYGLADKLHVVATNDKGGF